MLRFTIRDLIWLTALAAALAAWWSARLQSSPILLERIKAIEAARERDRVNFIKKSELADLHYGNQMERREMELDRLRLELKRLEEKSTAGDYPSRAEDGALPSQVYVDGH